MKPISYRVSLAYSKLNDDSLIVFVTALYNRVYAQAAYVKAPVTAPELLAGITAMSDSKVAQANGSKQATVVTNTRRAELLEMVQKLAYFIQLACDNDLALLMASGFDAVSINRTRSYRDQFAGL